MKKGLIYTLAVVIILGIGGGFWYHSAYGKTWYYGQVGNLYKTESQGAGNPKANVYRITGYNKQGEKKQLTVQSFGNKFTKGHYIAVGYSKAKGVITYKGVSWTSIPDKAQAKLPQPE